MNFKLTTLLALLVIFMGCSTEPITDSLELGATIEPETSLKAKNINRPFKSKASGTFQIVEPTLCDPLAQVAISGQGNATHLGLFTVSIDWCTDFGATHILTGTQTAANGDKLFFYSGAFGEDERGEWTDYIYDGGSGRFENATGKLRLYGISEFTSPTGGTFTNSGEGTLAY